MLGNLLLIPFIDTIIDTAQKKAKGVVFLESLPFSLSRMLKEVLYTLIIAFILIGSLVLVFIPVIGQVVAPIISMWALSMSSLTPMFERANMPLVQRVKVLNSILPSTISYGAGIFALLYIPIINVFLLGIAQASAVEFWVKHEGKLNKLESNY